MDLFVLAHVQRSFVIANVTHQVGNFQRNRDETLVLRIQKSKRRLCKGDIRAPSLGTVLIDGKRVPDVRIQKECPHCKKPFETSQYKPNSYCGSEECAHANMLATRVRPRRSYAEIRLEKLLKKVFKNVVGGDQRILDGYQLDIVIPELRISIEWDGYAHWFPAYGEPWLRKIQRQDAYKERKLLGLGWRVIRVKDSERWTASKQFIRQKFKAIVSLIKVGFDGVQVV